MCKDGCLYIHVSRSQGERPPPEIADTMTVTWLGRSVGLVYDNFAGMMNLLDVERRFGEHGRGEKEVSIVGIRGV